MFLARTGGVDAKDFDAWSKAIARATGKTPVKVEMLMNVYMVYPPNWRGDKFLPDVSSSRLSRLQYLTPTRLAPWRTAFARVDAKASDALVAALVANVDQLFDASGYRDDAASVVLRRFELLPPAAIKQLAETARRLAVIASSYVVSADFLFTGDPP